MRQIGLLFGSFNPLHNGHVMLADSAKNDMGLDEVWFVVQSKNTYKPARAFLDYEIRKQLITDSGLSLYESKSKDYTHFILETLHEVKNIQPVLILGEDLVDSFPKWSDYDQIRELAVVYESHRIDNISSGQVRDRLKNNQPIDDLVPHAVASHLKLHWH